MKITICLHVLCLLLAGLLPACHHNHNLEVTVSESDKRYQFTAYFDTSRTAAVQSYINREVSPNTIFGSIHDQLDIATVLDDKTTFHIESAPGKLTITLDKAENTTAAYHRVRKIGEGIRSILVQKH